MSRCPNMGVVGRENLNYSSVERELWGAETVSLGFLF